MFRADHLLSLHWIGARSRLPRTSALAQPPSQSPRRYPRAHAAWRPEPWVRPLRCPGPSPRWHLGERACRLPQRPNSSVPGVSTGLSERDSASAWATRSVDCLPASPEGGASRFRNPLAPAAKGSFSLVEREDGSEIGADVVDRREVHLPPGHAPRASRRSGHRCQRAGATPGTACPCSPYRQASCRRAWATVSWRASSDAPCPPGLTRH